MVAAPAIDAEIKGMAGAQASLCKAMCLGGVYAEQFCFFMYVGLWQPANLLHFFFIGLKTFWNEADRGS